MKKILALVLTVAMVLSLASAFAAPAKLSEISGLPELPAVPTMKTKNDGVTQTVTLSAPADSVFGIWNWQWIPMNFVNEEHTVATVAMAGHSNAAQGFGTYAGVWGNALGIYTPETDGVVDGPYSIEDLASVEIPDDVNVGKSNTHYWEQYYIYVNESEEAYVQVSVGGVYSGVYVQKYQDNKYSKADLAYDVYFSDGTNGKYDSHGNPIAYTFTVAGTNYLGNGESVTTTITVQFDGRRSWISIISESYADGSTATANFSSSMGGQCLSYVYKDADGNVLQQILYCKEKDENGEWTGRYVAY